VPGVVDKQGEYMTVNLSLIVGHIRKMGKRLFARGCRAGVVLLGDWGYVKGMNRLQGRNRQCSITDETLKINYKGICVAEINEGPCAIWREE